jgi:hypothetical protein
VLPERAAKKNPMRTKNVIIGAATKEIASERTACVVLFCAASKSSKVARPLFESGFGLEASLTRLLYSASEAELNPRFPAPQSGHFCADRCTSAKQVEQ